MNEAAARTTNRRHAVWKMMLAVVVTVIGVGVGWWNSGYGICWRAVRDLNATNNLEWAIKGNLLVSDFKQAEVLLEQVDTVRRAELLSFVLECANRDGNTILATRLSEKLVRLVKSRSFMKSLLDEDNDSILALQALPDAELLKIRKEAVKFQPMPCSAMYCLSFTARYYSRLGREDTAARLMRAALTIYPVGFVPKVDDWHWPPYTEPKLEAGRFWLEFPRVLADVAASSVYLTQQDTAAWFLREVLKRSQVFQPAPPLVLMKVAAASSHLSNPNTAARLLRDVLKQIKELGYSRRDQNDLLVEVAEACCKMTQADTAAQVLNTTLRLTEAKDFQWSLLPIAARFWLQNSRLDSATKALQAMEELAKSDSVDDGWWPAQVFRVRVEVMAKQLELCLDHQQDEDASRLLRNLLRLAQGSAKGYVLQKIAEVYGVHGRADTAVQVLRRMAMLVRADDKIGPYDEADVLLPVVRGLARRKRWQEAYALAGPIIQDKRAEALYALLEEWYQPQAYR